MTHQPITLADYTQAVTLLLPAAQGDTSGSRAAALVLLAAYNAREWPLDITDLCLLDGDHYQAALTVIRGRVELRIEPHTLIPDGGERLNALWEAWDQLHISNRQG